MQRWWKRMHSFFFFACIFILCVCGSLIWLIVVVNSDAARFNQLVSTLLSFVSLFSKLKTVFLLLVYFLPFSIKSRQWSRERVYNVRRANWMTDTKWLNNCRLSVFLISLEESCLSRRVPNTQSIHILCLPISHTTSTQLPTLLYSPACAQYSISLTVITFRHKWFHSNTQLKWYLVSINFH